MAAKYWLKLYHEMLDDPKVARLPDSSYRRFIECLLLAGDTDDNGRLPPIPDMAWRLRVDETTMSQDMSRLALAGLVELGHDDVWIVTQFNKRQAAVSGKDRVKEYRKRAKKREYNEGETEPVTNRYTDKIRLDKDKIRLDTYIEPDAPEIVEIKTALSKTTKTNQEFNQDEYDKAAYALFGYDATPDQIDGFMAWWETNGGYTGKPALKSLVNNWTSYREGLTVAPKVNANSNGRSPQANQTHPALRGQEIKKVQGEF